MTCETRQCQVCARTLCATEGCEATENCKNSVELHTKDHWACSKRCWEIYALIGDFYWLVQDHKFEFDQESTRHFAELVLRSSDKLFPK